MRRASLALIAVLAASAIAAWLLPASRAEPLPALKADLSRTSVSGLSSGGYMAGQFHVAYSKTVIGAGIVAAGPFGCAKSAGADALPFFPAALALNAAQAQGGCMADTLSGFGVLDSGRLVGIAQAMEQDGKIDPLENLKRGKVYLYSGQNDRTVTAAVVRAARDFYLAAGIPAKNVDFVSDKPGGHAFSTDGAGAACEKSALPDVNDCRYDQAGDILRFIYGALEPKGRAEAADFKPFDQSAFASSDASLAREGVVYAPPACRAEGRCRVHVVFHGCQQSRAEAGDAVIRESGFADWAASNNIVVLFPQVASSTLNPKSCWDWWGYTGLDYLSKDAPQMKAVAGMLAALAK
jgi:poly(3-hydroxybutyrate) depolymerase